MAALKLMTPQQAAEYLGRLGVQTSVRTLEAWRREDKGPGYLRVQGRIRYRREVVRQWVLQDETKGTGTAA